MFNIILTYFFVLQSSFYALSFNDIDGNRVEMSSFANKKVLLVNISNDSMRVNQLAGLQQLQQQYGDSVVIIGFPSNSFAHEERSNAEIKQFCEGQYGITFILAQKNSVAGTTIQPVYNWLAHASENGVVDGEVKADFQKFLISREGELVGIFSPSVQPTDSLIIKAITSNL